MMGTSYQNIKLPAHQDVVVMMLAVAVKPGDDWLKDEERKHLWRGGTQWVSDLASVPGLMMDD
jgi:hypothetical protein